MTDRTCSIDGCERPHSARGWCNTHYQRWYTKGDPLAQVEKRTPPTEVCTLEGCDSPGRSKDLCYAHYMKQWRYGTPTPDHGPKWEDLTGQRFGELTVTERNGDGWDCICDCGAHTFARAGDLNRGTKKSCGDRTTHWRADEVSYSGAHARVVSDRGLAAEHSCVDCGGDAYHWSYDHTDPDERTTNEGIPYSLDVDHYSPRCVPCHKRYDLDRIHHE